MRRLITTAVVAAAIAAAAATGTGIATAGGSDGGGTDDGADVAITGAALDTASTAALDFTGGGRVTGTEVGDEESYYEVEVTLANGDAVDVQLDETFAVVSSKTDSDTSGG